MLKKLPKQDPITAVFLALVSCLNDLEVIQHFCS